MTECERIIKEGFLPKNFFKAETICDYFVSEKMKKVWAIEIELLVLFDRVCRKHNLRYICAGGTCLGIVRHHGFIPWDDDVDVFMPRKDYQILVTQLRNEFKNQYKLLVPIEDGFLFSHAMLRNANTSSVVKGFMYEEFNQGIFLDIFPLDNCNIAEADHNWNLINNLIMTNSTNMRRHLKYPTERDLERIAKYPYRDPQEVFDEIERIAQQYNNEETEYAITATITPYPAKRLIFKWSHILNTIDVDFYGYPVKIPKDYDEFLKGAFGDYMKFPPIEDRGTWHQYSVFEPDVSYKKTLLRLREEDEVAHIK